jgi:hypothetical protein
MNLRSNALSMALSKQERQYILQQLHLPTLYLRQQNKLYRNNIITNNELESQSQFSWLQNSSDSYHTNGHLLSNDTPTTIIACNTTRTTESSKDDRVKTLPVFGNVNDWNETQFLEQLMINLTLLRKENNKNERGTSL